MWTYNNKTYIVPEDAEMKTYPYYGFVYLITNETNGMQYVGKKFFWSKKTLPITKTRKRRKVTYNQSDWVTYTGSSRQLNEDIESGHVIKKEILHLCETKVFVHIWKLKSTSNAMSYSPTTTTMALLVVRLVVHQYVSSKSSF